MAADDVSIDLYREEASEPTFRDLDQGYGAVLTLEADRALKHPMILRLSSVEASPGCGSAATVSGFGGGPAVDQGDTAP